MQVQNATLVSAVLALLEGIFDLPYCQNKHYHCLKYRPNIWIHQQYQPAYH